MAAKQDSPSQEYELAHTQEAVSCCSIICLQLGSMPHFVDVRDLSDVHPLYSVRFKGTDEEEERLQAAN
jgi:hypothetical protein